MSCIGCTLTAEGQGGIRCQARLVTSNAGESEPGSDRQQRGMAHAMGRPRADRRQRIMPPRRRKRLPTHPTGMGPVRFVEPLPVLQDLLL
jgi:hypothetical protein